MSNLFCHLGMDYIGFPGRVDSRIEFRRLLRVPTQVCERKAFQDK